MDKSNWIKIGVAVGEFSSASASRWQPLLTEAPLCFQESHVGAREAHSWALHPSQQLLPVVQRSGQRAPVKEEIHSSFTSKIESPFYRLLN